MTLKHIHTNEWKKMSHAHCLHLNIIFWITSMLHVSPPSDVCQWYYKYDKPLLAQDRRYMKPIYRMFATCTLEWLQNKWMKKIASCT